MDNWNSSNVTSPPPTPWHFWPSPNTNHLICRALKQFPGARQSLVRTRWRWLLYTRIHQHGHTASARSRPWGTPYKLPTRLFQPSQPTCWLLGMVIRHFQSRCLLQGDSSRFSQSLHKLELCLALALLSHPALGYPMLRKQKSLLIYHGSLGGSNCS